MKAHILTVLVIDFDELGSERVVNTLECANFPNDCIGPDVLGWTSIDIGDWDDDHMLNRESTQREYLESLGVV